MLDFELVAAELKKQKQIERERKKAEKRAVEKRARPASASSPRSKKARRPAQAEVAQPNEPSAEDQEPDLEIIEAVPVNTFPELAQPTGGSAEGMAPAEPEVQEPSTTGAQGESNEAPPTTTNAAAAATPPTPTPAPTSVSAEQPSSSTPTGRAITIHVGPQESSNMGRTARKLVQGICLPQDRRRFTDMSTADLFTVQCQALAETAHSLVTLTARTLNQADTVAQLSSTNKFLQTELEQEKRECVRQGQVANDLSSKLVEANENLKNFSNLVAAKDAEISRLRALLEEEKKKSSEEITGLSGQIDQLRSAREADQKKFEESAEELKRSAITEFRSSAEYAQESAANATQAYEKGFELCKGKVAKAFPDSDLGAIKIISDDEEEDEDSIGSPSWAS